MTNTHKYINTIKKYVLTNNSSFDQNDLIDYLFTRKQMHKNINGLIDFLMVDEIQDLPVYFLEYLSAVPRKSIYLSGDNAQNITKGSDLKFANLATSLEKKGKPTVFCPMTVNY